MTNSLIHPLIEYLLEQTRVDYREIVRGSADKLRSVPVVTLLTGENPYMKDLNHATFGLEARHLHDSYEKLRKIAERVVPLASQYKPHLVEDPLATLDDLLEIERDPKGF